MRQSCLDVFRSVRFCSFTPKLLRTYSEAYSEVCLPETPTDGRQRPRIGQIPTIRYLPGNERRGVWHEAKQPRRGSHTPHLARGPAAIGRSRMLSRSPLPELASGPPLRRHTRYRRRPCPSLSVLPTFCPHFSGNLREIEGYCGLSHNSLTCRKPLKYQRKTAPFQPFGMVPYQCPRRDSNPTRNTTAFLVFSTVTPPQRVRLPTFCPRSRAAADRTSPPTARPSHHRTGRHRHPASSPPMHGPTDVARP